ncbi:hypothetical protein ACFPM7_00080 [Actinokineospora guangxiensis]|uniref:Uncharacterized protein n=1 Tax=Actinokineospora guangxiensis TaxID=1490288 RepID=A0ABW0EGT5_9PSEU
MITRQSQEAPVLTRSATGRAAALLVAALLAVFGAAVFLGVLWLLG